MSLEVRRELLERYRPDYFGGTRAEKSRILSLICDSTGWNRKYVIGEMKGVARTKIRTVRKRKTTYGPNEEAALVKVWRLSGFLASKRLAPFMGEFLDVLIRHGELKFPELVASRLRAMSASTIDRLLRRHRASRPSSPSLTRPGSLKRQVVIRRGTEWADRVPGFCEVDTVAHCGGDSSGEYYWSLSLTDVETGWYEGAALRTRSQAETLRHIRAIRARLPFELKGIDSDNGGEFLNHHLLKYCRDEKICFTRGRPYVKNDQCRVEQKNGSIVRRHTGYGRYDREAQFKLLTKIYGILRLLVNFFEPSLKAKTKAMTPYRRLLDSGTLTESQQRELEAVYMAINPVTLRNELNHVKLELLEIQTLVKTDDDIEPLGQILT
jgi:hypothetical protein